MDLQLVSGLGYDTGHALRRQYEFAPRQWITVDDENDRAWLLNACPVLLRERVNLGYRHYRFVGARPQQFTFYAEDNAPFQATLRPGATYKFDDTNGRRLRNADKFQPVTVAKWLRANPSGCVLLLRGGGVGDLLFLTPALREVRRRFPNCHLHVAVAPHHRRVMQGNPAIDALTSRDEAYETAPHPFLVDLNYYLEAANDQQEVNRVNLFARALGLNGLADTNLAYAVTDEEREWVAETLRDLPRPIVAVQPHGSNPARHATAERMQQICAALKARGWSVVTVGLYAPADGWGSDLHIGDQVALGQKAAVLEAANAYLGMDSGLTHLANAVGTPGVALYGPIDGALRVTGYPTCRVLQGNEYVNCPPCNDNRQAKCGPFPQCMESIPIEVIVNAVADALKG